MAKNKYTDLDDNNDEWRDKYYASLEEIEKKEQLWQESDAVLRTLINRLTLAADQRHTKLNQQLEVLSDAIRDNVSALKLKNAVDEISSSIAELTNLRQSGNQTSQIAVKPFLDLINKLSPVDSISAKLKKIQKKLTSLEKAEEINPLTEELAKLLVAGLLVAEKRKGKGFFAGLISKDSSDEAALNTNPSPHEEDLVGQEIAEQEAILALQNLLQRMLLPQDLQLEANLIKRILLEQPNEKGFIQALDKTVALVAEVLARIKKEKRDIEEFLKQLTLRLHELDADLVQSSKLRELSNENGQNITDTMNGDISGIQSSIQSIRDLEELKTSIQSRVIVMRNHFDDYLTQEKNRNQQSLQLIQELQTKVQKMEAESEQLKQQLEKQRQQTLRDALTNVPNRMAYDERLATEIARFKRNHEPFVLMVWDVDYFKKINDTYGHASGDQVLKVVAGLLNKQIRESDFVGRYGGEEFVVILPDTELDGALQLAEKLRITIETAEFHFRNAPVKITASCGIAVATAQDTAESLFSRADQALYRAKQAGRNNCQIGK